MSQLIMYWKNDGAPAEMPILPEGTELKTFPEMPDATYTWLELVSYMDQGDPQHAKGNLEFYKKAMTDKPDYKEENCYFITVGGEAAATITVICNYEARDGYIHMVSAKPTFRGMGLGRLLSRIAEYVLKTEGMQTASLTTDDFRIPAIKTYLAIGFTPDTESQPDFRCRWEKIYEKINEAKQV